jgi:hypothetical protein
MLTIVQQTLWRIGDEVTGGFINEKKFFFYAQGEARLAKTHNASFAGVHARRELSHYPNRYFPEKHRAWWEPGLKWRKTASLGRNGGQTGLCRAGAAPTPKKHSL